MALAALTTTTTSEAAPHTTTARPPIVGSYTIVTHIKKPFPDEIDGSFQITSYNPNTGAITGHGQGDGADYAMTGTVHGTTHRHARHHQGRFPGDRPRDDRADGSIIGTIKARSPFGEIESGTWTMTRLATTIVVRESGFSEKSSPSGDRRTWEPSSRTRRRPTTLQRHRDREVLDADGKVVSDDEGL